MKKLLVSLTIGACALFSVSAQAAVESCAKPTDGNWTSYCSCFIKQAVNACKSCPAIHGTCSEAWLKSSLHHTTTPLISSQCTNQMNADSNNNCVAPGTTHDSCTSAVADYKAHCF